MTDMIEIAERIVPPVSDDGYEATLMLRWTRPDHTTTESDRLQQQWRKPQYDRWGHLSKWEYEWRDVPVEIVADR